MIHYFFKIILWLSGWGTFNIDNLQKVKKAVCVFTHTSYFDFYWFIMYKLAYPKINNKCHIAVKGSVFNSWTTPFLNYFNCFPTTLKEEKNKGFVKITVEKFKENPNFWIALDPCGQINLAPWKTGYYFIAKGLKIPIVTASLDYNCHKLIINSFEFHDHLNSDNDKLDENHVKTIQQSLHHITAIYPESSLVSNRRKSSSFFPISRLISVIFIFLYAVSKYF